MSDLRIGLEQGQVHRMIEESDGGKIRFAFATMNPLMNEVWIQETLEKQLGVVARLMSVHGGERGGVTYIFEVSNK